MFKFMLLVSFVLSVIFLGMGYFVPEQDMWYTIATYSIFALAFFIVLFISVWNFLKAAERVESFNSMVADHL